MNSRWICRSLLSLLLSITMVFSLVGCSSSSEKPQSSGDVPQNATNVVVDNVNINDSLVTLEIKGIENTYIRTDDINIDEILVNCIEVTDIDTIEIEFTSINDEFVYLAYKNFVSVYGDDFNLKDFLVDAGIGAGCILVYVTLSAAGGPVGTFFGAIITSQFTTSAVVIGTAIDAGVSAYMAYQEGGDASYIVGHMLNGIADGFKWSAILAPLTGAVDGIKALRAVNELRKVPGFEEVTDKEARKVFEHLADILKQSADIGDNFTDDAVKALSKELGDEISEDLLKNILSNRTLITNIVQKFNPFNVSSDVARALQDRFMKKAGLDDDVGKQLIKDIKKGAIKNLDDIADPIAREFIENNMYEFAQCFGSHLSKEFIDNCMRASMGDEAFDLIKSAISSDDLYFELLEKIGKDAADGIIGDSNTLILMQLRYGSKNVNKLMNAQILYNQLRKANTYIPDEQFRIVITGLLDGSIRSLDDVSKINTQIAKNMCGSYEIVAASIKSLGNEKALSGLLDDIARNSLESLNFTPDFSRDLIQNSLSKAEIISKYGDDIYSQLISNYNFSVNCLGTQAKINSTLIEDMTTDFLKGEGLADDVINGILSGRGISEWGIPDKKIMDIWNVVSDYYRISDASVYRNYVLEIAELRGEYISDFVTQYKAAGNTIRNSSYAGCIMQPTGANPAYIKAKYGDIYMSKQGFVILDDYAVARVQLTGLTGLNGGADDIARANLVHHGTRASIPGYTWHHLEDGKTMILIPTELHDAYRHTGGADLLREGLREAIENGAY